MLSDQKKLEQQRGKRTEKVVEWYFRLNGFMSLPGFIVHLDHASPYITQNGETRIAWTEADLIAVRFHNSCEIIDKSSMIDDPILTGQTSGNKQALFVLVEIKAGVCSINPAWEDNTRGNMERVIRRMGFACDDYHVSLIASAMYNEGYWEEDHYVLQHICVGKNKSQEWQHKRSKLVQIVTSDIAAFLLNRFQKFPEKLPGGQVHQQWPTFGKAYAKWYTENQMSANVQSSQLAVERYIDTGRCDTHNLQDTVPKSQDEVAFAVASATAAANKRAHELGILSTDHLLYIAYRTVEGQNIWEITYGPQPTFDQRGGGLIIEVNAQDNSIRRVLRGQ